MRIQNEQSGSTSLFAQPMAIEPVPEQPEIRDQRSGISNGHTAEIESVPEPAPAKLARGMLEARMEAALGFAAEAAGVPSTTVRQAIWRCSSAGTTGRKRGGRERFSFQTPRAAGR